MYDNVHMYINKYINVYMYKNMNM